MNPPFSDTPSSLPPSSLPPYVERDRTLTHLAIHSVATGLTFGHVYTLVQSFNLPELDSSSVGTHVTKTRGSARKDARTGLLGGKSSQKDCPNSSSATPTERHHTEFAHSTGHAGLQRSTTPICAHAYSSERTSWYAPSRTASCRQDVQKLHV